MAKHARGVPVSSLWVTALMVAAMAAPWAQANTIEVPGDAASLSAAIALAQSGDTILVGDGTWKGPANRDLVISGKDVVIRSVHGPAVCAIDCEMLGRALTLIGCSSATLVQGLTIRNGQVLVGQTAGQGVSIVGGAPVLRECVLESCGFKYEGFDFGPSGGAVRLSDSSALIEDCSFNSNKAEFGGAVSALRGAPVLRRCLFRDNSGVAHIEPGIPVGGFDEGAGGALNLAGCDGALVVDCVFDGNESVVQSGAIQVSQLTGVPSTGRISLCTFTRTNVVYSFLEDTAPGQVIKVSGNASSGLQWQIDHSIVWGNIATNAPILGPANGFKVISSDVQGGYVGTGNIASDPRFFDFSSGDVHLLATSPCVDTDPQGALPFGEVMDLDHGSRLIDGDLDGHLALDMGAFERTNVSLAVSGPANPGSTLSLSLRGKAGLSCVVALGLPLTGPPLFDAKLGYSLSELGSPWTLVTGSAPLPATTTFVVPFDLVPGSSFLLQPIAWAPGGHAGNFGAPRWVVVP
jgi:hypothetical protein